ncbi:hypothetical protein DVB87_25940 [Tsukamurella tyrosinosolvens]|nr:hypothetical protein DVB87_25940 [Tsukamurella tyrosinosolvens]
MYVHSGRRAYFIPESRVQTPDLLIDDAFEVECKQKAAMADGDRARFELYEILNRKLRGVFPERIKHGAIVVEVDFEVEPRRELVDQIVNECRLGLRQEDSSSFEVAEPGVFSARVVIQPQGEGPTDLILPLRNGEFDTMSTSAVIVDDNQSLGRFVNLAIKCRIRQERVKSVIKSVRSAARQFSGRLPAVVAVDISAIAATGDDNTLAHLREDLVSTLRNHTTVSRVELYTTRFVGELEEQIYRTDIEEIDNPYARFPFNQ